MTRTYGGRGVFSFESLDDEDGCPTKTQVIAPDGTPVCWLPGVAGDMLRSVYMRRATANITFANTWLEGVIFGLHHALAFSNQIPRIEMTFTEAGDLIYRMTEREDDHR